MEDGIDDDEEEKETDFSDSTLPARRTRIDEDGLIAYAVLAYAANVNDLEDALSYLLASNKQR